MTNHTNTISIPRPLLRKKGVVVLPLEEWEKFKEDLEMIKSKKLAQDIAYARAEAKKGKVLSLEEVEKKLIEF